MKVCVVGAGPSGLVTIKELLEEGHEPVCFEKSNAIGGVFHCENGKVYDSTLLTVSNYFMAFSSFPPPKDDTRDFWTHERYFEYLEDFCDHFSLQPHIQFNSEIRNIKRLSGGSFAVTVASADEISETLFDAVAVCTGTHQIPKRPEFKEEQDFRGFVDHYNDERYHDSLSNLTPADVYYGRGESMLARRKQIKLSTMVMRRKMHARNRVKSLALMS